VYPLFFCKLRSLSNSTTTTATKTNLTNSNRRFKQLFIKKNPSRCNNVSKFYYSIFIWSSTCFGRHTAHHQEPKTVLATSGFSYVEGCWTCSWWTLSGTVCASQRPPTTCPVTFHIRKTKGCQYSFRLMMGRV
jgi:hypothetical protein